MTSVILTVFDMAAVTSPPLTGGSLGRCGEQAAEGAVGSGGTPACNWADGEDKNIPVTLTLSEISCFLEKSKISSASMS